MPMPSYTDLRMNYKDVFQKVYTDYMFAINPLINNVESLLSNLMIIMERMRRLQFLTHALLLQSPLTCKDIKVPPPLPKELQQGLLKKPFVTGCGTIYGQLVIHVKSAISEQQKEDIEGCIKVHGYLFPYKVEVFIPEFKKSTGPLVIQRDPV